MNKKVYNALPFISVAIILLAWYLGALALNIEYLLPSPISTFRQMLGMFASGSFYLSVLNTLLHALLSFLFAFTCAIICAVVSYFSKAFERLFYPLVVVLRVMPTISVIFLAIIWSYGPWLTNNSAPYLICFCVLFPLLYSNALNAIRGVDSELVQMSMLYGVKRKDLLRYLYLPSIANSLYNDSVTLLSFAVKLAVSGEAIAQSKATLGFMLKSSNANFETGALIAYTVVAILLGYFMEFLVHLVVKCIRRAKSVKIK